MRPEHRRAIDYLKVQMDAGKVGRDTYFRDGPGPVEPCCSVGHLAWSLCGGEPGISIMEWENRASGLCISLETNVTALNDDEDFDAILAALEEEWA